MFAVAPNTSCCYNTIVRNIQAIQHIHVKHIKVITHLFEPSKCDNTSATSLDLISATTDPILYDVACIVCQYSQTDLSIESVSQRRPRGGSDTHVTTTHPTTAAHPPMGAARKPWVGLSRNMLEPIMWLEPKHA